MAQTFLEQIAPFHPKPFFPSVSGSVIWKLKALVIQKTLELHHDQQEFMKKYLCELRQFSFTAPKNTLLVDIKFFLPSKKKDTILNDLHPYKGMNETFFLTWCASVYIYFFFGLYFV